MTGRLRTLVVWLLDPAKRRALYGLLAGVGVVLAAAGIAQDTYITGVVGVVVAVVDAAAIILAAVKARRGDWTVIYAALAAVVTAITVAGWISDAESAWTLHLLAQVVALGPLVAAFVRTSAATPTGEPVGEYQARLRDLS